MAILISPIKVDNKTQDWETKIWIEILTKIIDNLCPDENLKPKFEEMRDKVQLKYHATRITYYQSGKEKTIVEEQGHFDSPDTFSKQISWN